MQLKQVLLALLFCPILACAQDAQENLLKIRYLAFSATSHLLLYYNTSTGRGDPQHAEKYRADLQRLQEHLHQVPSPALQTDGRRFQALIDDLELKRDDQKALYPIWINPILESQAKLDKLAQQLSQTAEAESAALQQLQGLTLNSQRLLLFYQTRVFGSLAVYVDAIKQGAPNTLDQAILQDFAALHSSLPEHAKELAKLERAYNYIRHHLLQQEGEFVPESVAYYMEQIGSKSQQIAERIRPS
jgi:hypothetical protein